MNGLNAKKIHSISISRVANDSDILADLVSLLTSDLASIKKEKYKEFKKKQSAVSW